MIVGLAIALTLFVCSAAWAMPAPIHPATDGAAQPSGPVAERTYSYGAAQQSGPVAERTYSEASSAAPSPAAPVTAATPAVVPDDGLGALIIVLISVGGALTLVGAAYTARRVVMHHGHAAG
jgi:hypothetical protein